MISVDFMKPAKLAVPEEPDQPQALARRGLGAAEREGLNMRLTIIGCGDAFGSGGRFNTCFMIEAGGRTVLLDCGASSLVALKARNIDLEHDRRRDPQPSARRPFRRAAVLSARRAVAEPARERPLTIAGPPGTRERLDAACEVFFPRSSTNAWRFPLEIVEIAPGVPDEVLGFAVRTAEVIHQSGAPRPRFG